MVACGCASWLVSDVFGGDFGAGLAAGAPPLWLSEEWESLAEDEDDDALGELDDLPEVLEFGAELDDVDDEDELDLPLDVAPVVDCVGD